jgi:hypothetical protein
MAKVDDVTTQEMADLLRFFEADPRFLRLLYLAKDTTLAQKIVDFTAFINE